MSVLASKIIPVIMPRGVYDTTNSPKPPPPKPKKNSANSGDVHDSIGTKGSGESMTDKRGTRTKTLEIAINVNHKVSTKNIMEESAKMLQDLERLDLTEESRKAARKD